jgi:hypothetical protein
MLNRARKENMSESKFKTMRHIETVRNYLGIIIKEFIDRSARHDQSKLETPEVEAFEVLTPRLRGLTYGSEEYKASLREMKPSIDHHYANNSHHPEYYSNGINGMNLFDLMEMLVDWKSAGLRHADGNIYKSLEINKDRYKISDQLYEILKNTANLIESKEVYHKANES